MKNVSLQTFKKRAVRHGEVMIVPVAEIPADAEQIFEGREYIVGHSETGHHHVAVGELPASITIFRPRGADSAELFMRVNADARIEHRKTFDLHETKSLAKGLYQVTIKRAYNYFKKVQERVVD